MNQDTMLLLVRGIGWMIAIMLVWIAFRLIIRQMIAKGTDDPAEPHPKARGSALDKGVPLPPDSLTEFDRDGVSIKHRTSRLNPRFFGGISKENKSLSLKKTSHQDNSPTMNLPLTIMARHGKFFTGSEIDNLFKTFGLKRSPNNAYELIAEKGEILFTVLNVRKPGVFPKDFSTLNKIEGLLLILQLPVGEEPQKSLETFLAMAAEMSDSMDGRLCDYARCPMGEKDIINYRRAADVFERDYNEWLAKQAS